MKAAVPSLGRHRDTSLQRTPACTHTAQAALHGCNSAGEWYREGGCGKDHPPGVKGEDEKRGSGPGRGSSHPLPRSIALKCRPRS